LTERRETWISILIKNKKLLPVEELVNEADVNKAQRITRLAQDLERRHRRFERKSRSDLNQFSDLTKQMHDKREILFENLRGTELENLEKKK
jgi:hypothetical protein